MHRLKTEKSFRSNILFCDINQVINALFIFVVENDLLRKNLKRYILNSQRGKFLRPFILDNLTSRKKKEPNIVCWGKIPSLSFLTCITRKVRNFVQLVDKIIKIVRQKYMVFIGCHF